MFYLSPPPKPLDVIIIFCTIFFAIVQSSQPEQQWPANTLASASTTHPPNNNVVYVAGQFTTDKAIDNNAATYWNDNTYEGYPDIFYLNIGSVVHLDGLLLLSQNDGWPLNYTVETSPDGASWTLAATVELSNVVLRLIKFDNSPLKVKQLQINVTAAINAYTRIAELSPIYAAGANSTSDDSPLSTLIQSSSTTAPKSSTRETKSSTVGIIAGFLGGVVAFLVGALGYFVWLQRKSTVNAAGVKGAGEKTGVDGTQKNPLSGSSYQTIIRSELRGWDPQEAGGYPRNELA